MPGDLWESILSEEILMGGWFSLIGPEELGKIPFHNKSFLCPPKKVLVVFFWGGEM